MSVVPGALFETERLNIRPWSLDDAAQALAIYRDPEVWRWLGGGEPLADLESARAMLQRWIDRSLERAPCGVWAVVACASGFRVLDLDSLVGVVFPENPASQRVLEKAGLTYRGPRRTFGFELMCYAIGRET